MKGLAITDTRLSVNAESSGKPTKPGGWAILKQDMVKSLPKRDVFIMVLISVARAFADMNVKDISEADRDYLVNELTDNILKYHPSIRLNEIPEALSLGIRGKYGEFYGLSVVTFLKFIEQYLLSEKRTAMVKAQVVVEEPRLAPSLQAQFETAKYNAMQALRRRTDGKDIASIATSVYNFLDRLSLIVFTKAEKYDMLADATRELLKELKLKLMIARESERNAIKDDIEAYTRAITTHSPVDDRQSALVKMCAKKLALTAFLNNILLEGVDLDALIEEKREMFTEAD